MSLFPSNPVLLLEFYYFEYQLGNFSCLCWFPLWVLEIKESCLHQIGHLWVVGGAVFEDKKKFYALISTLENTFESNSICCQFWCAGNEDPSRSIQKQFSIVTKVCHHPERVTVKKDYNIPKSSSLIFSFFCSIFLKPIIAIKFFYSVFVREDEATALQSSFGYHCLSMAVYSSWFLGALQIFLIYLRWYCLCCL